MSDGKKIEDKFENPIDILLIKISGMLNPLFYKLNFTPNMITTLSLLLSVYGIYMIYIGSYRVGAILYFIGYLFDCMDGNYARKYNMTSEFGDYYDHISDMTKIFLLALCIYLIKIKSKTKIFFFLFTTIMFLLTLSHLGCQEHIKNKNDKSVLELFKVLCKNSNYIYITKYFGCGTTQLLIASFIFNIKFIDRFF